MKKLHIILVFLLVGKISSAQLLLNGSSYTQDFSSLGSNVPLPDGWLCYTGASATTLGTDVTAAHYYESPVSWTVFNGEFRNSASANSFAYYGSIDSASQKTVADRAFAVRQVSNTNGNFPNSDPGAAFVLKINNTIGLTDFNLSFKLQSLDSTSPRITTWTVDYGTGSNPATFTPLTTSPVTLTTGGNTFSNTTVTVTVGNALDNQAGPVWIRVVALDPSTGASNRTTTAIDDFNLSWTGVASGIQKVKVKNLPVTVLGGINSSHIPVAFSTEHAGKATACIYDITGKKLYSSVINVNNGENYVTLSPASLAGGMYLVEIRDEQNYGVAKAIVE